MPLALPAFPMPEADEMVTVLEPAPLSAPQRSPPKHGPPPPPPSDPEFRAAAAAAAAAAHRRGVDTSSRRSGGIVPFVWRLLTLQGEPRPKHDHHLVMRL